MNHDHNLVFACSALADGLKFPKAPMGTAMMIEEAMAVYLLNSSCDSACNIFASLNLA